MASPFSFFKFCLVLFFFFIQILLEANSGDHYLVLHCLPMSHKKDAMLILVNLFFGNGTHL